MAQLRDIITFCDTRVDRASITDFPGAHNGLQFENDGSVTKIGAAVDAGLKPFQAAADAGVDLLIVHHGMFWSGTSPITDAHYQKLKILFDNNIAVYSSHLPLDGHREIGNNAIIAQKLGLPIKDWMIEYEGNTFIPYSETNIERGTLAEKIKNLFPSTFTPIECGPENIQKIAIASGSAASVVDSLKGAGVDTLICGELKQQHYNQAEEEGLNLYPCGHYATETFGIEALAQEAAAKFDLPYTFLPTNCPL